MEVIVLAEEPGGRLWVTYTQGNKVWVAHSTTSDAAWTAPFALTAPGAGNLTPDDISSVIAYGGNIGVMYSNQNDEKMYFASHANGASDLVWSTTVAVSGPKMADDHISLKRDSAGRVYALTKTSRNDVSASPSEPMLILSVFDGAAWVNYVAAYLGEGSPTRGIVLLDEGGNRLSVFYTSKEGGGYIKVKDTALNAISFTGSGSPFIQSSSDTTINNATSFKDNVTPASGAVVLAGDDGTKFYLHNSRAAAGPATVAKATGVARGSGRAQVRSVGRR
jgi:hypothetical protein